LQTQRFTFDSSLFSLQVLLLRERDKEVLAKELEKFYELDNSATNAFFTYFNKFYRVEDRLVRWSPAWRLFYHASQENNMFAESWHNQLKIHHLHKKRNRRVDKLLDALQAAEKWYYMKATRHAFGRLSQPMQEREQKRKAAGLAIPDSNVAALSTDAWHVKSSRSEEHWTVERKRPYQNCPFRCSTTDCPHSLACNCPDFLASFLPCKHIWRLLSTNSAAPMQAIGSSNSSSNTPPAAPPNIQNATFASNSLLPRSNTVGATPANNLSKPNRFGAQHAPSPDLQKQALAISDMLCDSTVSEQQRKLVLAHIAQAQAIAGASSHQQQQPAALQITDNIHVNANHIPLTQEIPRKKRRTVTNRPELSLPTPEETASFKDLVLNEPESKSDRFGQTSFVFV
jgi:hypothetical protein